MAGASGLVSLGMIGGFLHMKTPKIISEYLPVAKMLDGGGSMGGIVSSVLQGGGLQAIMTNPLAQVSSQVQSTISRALSSGSDLPGLSDGVSSSIGLGNLSTAVSGLLGSAGSLLSADGILSVVSHSNTVGSAGGGLPSSLGLDVVLAPVFADGMLSQVDVVLNDLIDSVVAGTATFEDLDARAQQLATAVSGVTSASSTALATVSAAAPAIAAVNALAALTVSAPPLVRDALTRGLDPAVVQQMVDSLETHVA